MSDKPNKPWASRVLVVEIVAPTQKLADKYIRQLNRTMSKASNAMLRKAEVRKANIGFCFIESNTATAAIKNLKQ